MAFFGLTDIKFNDIERRSFGPLGALDSNPYFKNTLRYPIDIGAGVDKGHYMIFFVREQKNTKFSASPSLRGGVYFPKEVEQNILKSLDTQLSGSGLVSPSSKKDFASFLNDKIGGALSKGGNFLSKKGGTTGKLGGAINNFVSGPQKAQSEEAFDPSIGKSVAEISDKSPFDILNTTRLTTDAIALYMPDTLNFDSNANYSELSLGNDALAQGVMAASEVASAYASGLRGSQLASVAVKSGTSYQLAEKALKLIQPRDHTFTRLGLYASTNRIVNPMLELIYSSPTLRKFQFEFMFYPRSEKEAFEVQRIIDRFRFHQAPELDKYESGRQTGMLIPPSEFDIKFYYGGRQNPNIPPIATCVLSNVQVNFAPRGWSAYEAVGENVPALGRTGMPVAIQMSLQFTETTYLTKEDFGSQSLQRETSAPENAQAQSGSYLGRPAAFGKTA
jgi:hypothetical protein